MCAPPTRFRKKHEAGFFGLAHGKLTLATIYKVYKLALGSQRELERIRTRRAIPARESNWLAI
jgi:hypothetical protein